MIYVFYFFATVLILLSYRSFRGGIAYLRFFKTELAKPSPDFTPFVTIIAPCKGLDQGLKENLAALFQQDYGEYQIVFVVDDAGDAAVPEILSLFGQEYERANSSENSVIASAASVRAGQPFEPSAKLVVAHKAANSAQKIENLREAVRHADSRSEVFIFVDSDARPSQNWLRYLVAPLADSEAGATTGYRWFISPKPSFGSEMRSAWNASIASALGPNIGSNFCWGGSMAIRRDVFDRIGMSEKWAGTLSDDFAVTRAMKEASLSIIFVPQALTASVENCSLTEMLEFTTRQMKITRVYAPDLWKISLVGSALFNVVMIATALVAIFDRSDVMALKSAIATMLLVSIFSVGKSWLRLSAVRLALTEYERDLKRQFWTQNTLWLLAPAIFLVNSVTAGLSRRVTWRGIRYELKSPTETVIIAD